MMERKEYVFYIPVGEFERTIVIRSYIPEELSFRLHLHAHNHASLRAFTREADAPDDLFTLNFGSKLPGLLVPAEEIKLYVREKDARTKTLVDNFEIAQGSVAQQNILLLALSRRKTQNITYALEITDLR